VVAVSLEFQLDGNILSTSSDVACAAIATAMHGSRTHFSTQQLMQGV